MKIIVVIVNFNTSQMIEDLLPELVVAGKHELSVSILDNYSRLEERQRLRKLGRKFPNVSISFSPKNLGFGAGINKLIRDAEPKDNDLIWILNPDTRVNIDVVNQLAEIVSGGRNRVVSPLIVTGLPDDRTIWYMGGEMNERTGKSIHFHYGESLALFNQMKLTATKFMTGAAPMMNFQTWKTIGGFREDFFLYWEDVEWSARANKLGVEMLVDQTSQIWHAEGGSSGGSGLNRIFYYYLNRNRLLECSNSWERVNRGFGIGVFETIRQTLKPLLLERETRWEKTLFALYGLWDGLRGKNGQLRSKQANIPEQNPTTLSI